MKDAEMELWRQQWQGQPTEVMNLVRRVERESIAMRFAPLAFLAPAGVAAATTVVIALNWQRGNHSIGGVLFAAGLWLSIGISLWFWKHNARGVWNPAAETTTAYIELSIERCRRTERGYRFGRVMAPLVTAFVFLGVYKGMKSGGHLTTTADYWIVAATFLWTICIIAFVMLVNHRQMKKMRDELKYLLRLQQQLSEQREQ